ncbi:RNA 2',3'-cyclic phosphodiesterase [bacterium]|nr:RNA 2',3'-cyclic phosphodiesterase [bacterium]
MTNDKTSRLFYAIELPKPIERILNIYINNYKHSVTDKIKWVNSRSIHLTLRFMGEVGEETIALLISVLDEIVTKCEPFTYELNGIGCFPNLSKPRVIFIGAGQGKEQITAIADKIESRIVSSIGLTPEKKIFKPHITIGRLKIKGKPSLSKKCLKLITNDKNKTFGEFAPEYCSLIKSVLTKEGPVYTTVHKSFF